MRVLHVIPSVAARDGGPAVVAVETVRALRAAGCDAALATTDADGDDRLGVPTGTWTSWDGIPALFFRRVASTAFKWSPALAAWVGAHAGEYDIVDVHAVFSHASIAAGRGSRRAVVPYVVRPHGALDPWSLGRKSWRKRAVLAAGGRRLLAGAARMQYTTSAEQQLAERALPWLPPGVVVPLAVDDAWFEQRAAREESPIILAMSRLEQKKGLELLIDAFAAASTDPAMARWRLVLAGDGARDYVSALQARAAASGASARIEFVGWVSGEAKRELLRSAALLASPSLQENFGLSIAEAMAAGVPVLVSPGVNLADEVAASDAGWVVPRDLGALAAQLRTTAHDAAARARAGQAARRLAVRYRWSRSAALLADLYRDVAASEPSVGRPTPTRLGGAAR